MDWYKHPNRHPKNIDGPFYSLATDWEDDEYCHSECLDCDLPQLKAPTLLKSLQCEDGDTYFIKQPETESEINQAIAAAKCCCVNALRYGGKDPTIIKSMGQELCDHNL